MENLFIVNYDREHRGDEYDQVVLMRAAEGRYRIDQDGNRYLVMSDGERFEVDPGNAEYGRSSYGEYLVKLETRLVTEETEIEDQSTTDLLLDPSPAARVELQWRLSLMIMVPIVVFMAVPLAKVNPRQGRYLKMLPAILLYLAYLSLMMAVKGAIEKGQLPEAVGIFWVHAIFLAVGAVLNYWPKLRLNRSKRRMRREEC